jgi:hypothetical protein
MVGLFQINRISSVVKHAAEGARKARKAPSLDFPTLLPSTDGD